MQSTVLPTALATPVAACPVAPASLAGAFADVPAVPPNDRDDTELFPGCDGVHDASTSIQQV